MYGVYTIGLFLSGLRKVYPPHHIAVHDLWFDVADGQVFGFLGNNGAGKSTTINCLMGKHSLTLGNSIRGVVAGEG